MADPEHDLIHFRCPHCTARLKAQARKAGKRQRCPMCQTILHVPVHSKIDKPGEEYQVSDAEAAAGTVRAYVPVICGACNTRMYATKDQVGTQIVCPDCGTAAVVPSPPETTVKGGASTGKPKGYPPREEVDAAGTTARATDQKYIPVYCSLCRTLMQVTEDRVGQKVVCPHCGTETLVRRPGNYRASKDPQRFRISPKEQYDVQEGPGQPPPTPGAVRKYVPVVCSFCGTRLHATGEWAGRQIVCPKCGERLEVDPSAAPRKPPLTKGVDEGYGVRADIKVPKHEEVDDWQFIESLTDAATARRGKEKAEWQDTRPPMPRRPMLSGILTFLFYRGVLVHWIAQSAFAALVVSAAVWALIGAQNATPTNWIISLLLTGASVVLGCLAIATICIDCLAIVNDTAAGNDSIENWSNPAFFLDWFGDIFYVVSSLALGAVSGVGIGWLLERLGWSRWAQVLLHFVGTPLDATEEVRFVSGAIALFVLFPILLLSMLETGSPLNPISLPVWRGVRAACWTCLLFYAETALLVLAVGWLVLQCMTLPRWTSIAGAMVVLIAALFIYFRLLGRLAWCCARAGGEEQETEDAEEESENKEKEKDVRGDEGPWMAGN